MNLNQAQEKAVSHKEGPCLVLAGPGSGKTLTIVKRIEYLIKMYKVRPEEILVITFTKYAANEMKERFRNLMGRTALPVTFGTFHGIYYGILKWAYGWNRANILTDEERTGMLRELVSRTLHEDMPEGAGEPDFIKELSEEIGNIKNNRTDIGTYESRRCGTSWFRDIYLQYEKEKRNAKKVDFEDMLVRCLELFESRPDILEKWQKKFRYILIDEFQDINQIQYDVIRMLARPENHLFAVGDDDQSVYGFRGAKPEIMKTFLKDYPRASKIILDINYRSSAHIVNGALRVIGHNRNRYEKKIRADQRAEETVHVQETQNAADEAQYILEQYHKYRKQGVADEQMAVLYRTAADAGMAAEQFVQHQIPFHMRERIAHAYEHFICTDMESYFRLALKQAGRREFLQVANRPNRYIGRDSMSDGAVSYESLRTYYCDKEWMQNRIDQFEWDIKMLCGKTPYTAMQYIRKSIGYDEFLKEYSGYAGLEYDTLKDVLLYIQERAKEFRTLEEWLGHVKNYREMLRKQAKEQKAGRGVEFLTMHGAKGLEYEVVFMIHCNEGIIPYKKAQTEEETEEERRLFYVAMTRAKRKLVISYVKEKNGKNKNPSRFISELFLQS